MIEVVMRRQLSGNKAKEVEPQYFSTAICNNEQYLMSSAYSVLHQVVVNCEKRCRLFGLARHTP